MHAILRIDLQTVVTGISLHELIHASRAVAGFRACILSQVDLDWYLGILQRQMNRLIFAVIGIRNENR